MCSKSNKLYLVILSLLFSIPAFASEELEVKITDKLAQLEVIHNGKPVVIQRNQDQGNMIDEDFALTSRACPPFCLQPMNLLPGVKTIGELELLELLEKKAKGDKSILVIDSRTPDWVAKGTIPSAINIPWTKLFPQAESYEPFEVEGILSLQFGATLADNIWDFSNAKTLVMFCNGPWCGQSPTNIKALVNLGYPAHKIFWYRGGMQAWQAAGLTTVAP
ncbi:rhodanese-like domain-containing protein [Thiomicrorhabdus sediminis]|uniref:Rhodanese-like domain-containing protein n=1 Tax=Thiomicrorhabdus sediminis TaxID=2580412 RepID=A0A4P9K5B6_9GAMM|nr:rhodanese-like domain-containing protein [Thiomicrorhabdus sediminis]QCU90048.1 rhodanese-like domain-containing protein [Thiomicrorhabdus sediminis]